MNFGSQVFEILQKYTKYCFSCFFFTNVDSKNLDFASVIILLYSNNKPKQFGDF